MNQHHCPLCGCSRQRRCRTLGWCPDEHHVLIATEHGIPVYGCTMKEGERCSDCRRCAQCGDPLGGNPQLIAIHGHKVRLCAGCQLVPTGIHTLDALLEAMACCGDPKVVSQRARVHFGRAPANWELNPT